MMDGSTHLAQARRNRAYRLMLLLLSSVWAGWVCAAPVEIEALTVEGQARHGTDVSAATVVGGFLVIAADEGHSLQVLEHTEGTYRFRAETLPLLAGSVEADIEGLASDGPTVYAIGSHSLKRRKMHPEKSAEQNRKRLETVIREPSRHRLFRMTLDPETGKPTTGIEQISLDNLLADDKVLSRFVEIPGKENGIDIEGLALKDERLWIGLRSPVLRDGLVPVIVVSFDNPLIHEIRFVDTGGRGIRSLAAVKSGFLMILAYESSKHDAYELCVWGGGDRFSSNGPAARPNCLGRIPSPEGGKPEGLVVLEETAERYEILVVYDGAPSGAPARLTLSK